MSKKQHANIAKRREAKKRSKALKRREHAQSFRAKQRTGVLKDGQFLSDLGLPELVETSALGLPKLSAAILDYAQPLFEDCDSRQARKNAVAIAIMCWNCSLFPDDTAADKVAEMIDTLTQDDATQRPVLDQLFEFMTMRKKLFFAEDKRSVSDFNIVDLEDGDFHLRVISSPLGDNRPVENAVPLSARA